MVPTLNDSECGHELENRAELVADFGSGCGQNFEGSTAARTHGMSQCMNCGQCHCVTPFSYFNKLKECDSDLRY